MNGVGNVQTMQKEKCCDECASIIISTEQQLKIECREALVFVPLGKSAGTGKAHKIRKETLPVPVVQSHLVSG